jgi:hypothetical protein
MAVDPRQPDAAAGGGRVQRRPRWPGLDRPVVLVPATADDPGVPGGAPRPLGDLGRDLDQRRRASQVELLQLRAEPEHVTVRIVQTGQDGASSGVDHPRRRTAPGQRLGVGADVDQPVAGDRHGLRLRRRARGCVDDAVVHDQVGGLGHAGRLRRELARTRRDDRERHQQPHRTPSIAARLGPPMSARRSA